MEAKKIAEFALFLPLPPTSAPPAPPQNAVTHGGTQRHTATQQPIQTAENQSFTAPSPPVVQYMYSICTVFVRFGSVQILYIYCTYTVQRAVPVVAISALRRPRTALSAPPRARQGIHPPPAAAGTGGAGRDFFEKRGQRLPVFGFFCIFALQIRLRPKRQKTINQHNTLILTFHRPPQCQTNTSSPTLTKPS